MIDHPERILEAAIFSSSEPLPADKLTLLFPEDNRPSLGDIRTWIANLQQHYAERGVELVEVASGYRFQARADSAAFIQRLQEQKPPRYSRAFLETLALIAYRQPITRGEIEDVRGVAVNPNIIKTLLEREWIKIAGYRDAPGKPALFATTKIFLDYFNLKKISDLPALSELVDFEKLEQQLGLQLPTPVNAEESSPSAEVSAQSTESIEMDSEEVVAIEEEVVS